MTSNNTNTKSIFPQILIIVLSLALCWALDIFIWQIIPPNLSESSMLLFYIKRFAVLMTLPVCFIVYLIISRKLLKESKPLLWLLFAIVFDILTAFRFKFALVVIIRDKIFYSCFLCCVVYFIEWISTQKEQMYDRRRIFSSLGLTGVFLLIIAGLKAIIFDVLIGNSHQVSMPVIIVYMVLAMWRFLNGFGGISNESCERYLGSTTEGSYRVFHYERLAGKEAVLFGIRSILLWLSLGALYFMSTLYFDWSRIFSR